MYEVDVVKFYESSFFIAKKWVQNMLSMLRIECWSATLQPLTSAPLSKNIFLCHCINFVTGIKNLDQWKLFWIAWLFPSEALNCLICRVDPLILSSRLIPFDSCHEHFYRQNASDYNLQWVGQFSREVPRNTPIPLFEWSSKVVLLGDIIPQFNIPSQLLMASRRMIFHAAVEN